MNQRNLSAWIAIASFLIPSIGLAILPHGESAVAAEIVTSKRAPFYSKAGRFSINFPTKPTASTGNNSANGKPVYSFQVIDEASFYQVAYSDVSILNNLSREEVRKIISYTPAAYAKELQLEIADTNDIALGNNIGLEFKLARAGQIIGLGRTYISGSRVYMAISVGKSPTETSSFLNSFRLR